MKITIDVETIARLAEKHQEISYNFDTPFMDALRELHSEMWEPVDKIMTEQLKNKYKWQKVGNVMFIDHTQSE